MVCFTRVYFFKYVVHVRTDLLLPQCSYNDCIDVHYYEGFLPYLQSVDLLQKD